MPQIVIGIQMTWPVLMSALLLVQSHLIPATDWRRSSSAKALKHTDLASMTHRAFGANQLSSSGSLQLPDPTALQILKPSPAFPATDIDSAVNQLDWQISQPRASRWLRGS
jgi:hypothetical protein